MPFTSSENLDAIESDLSSTPLGAVEDAMVVMNSWSHRASPGDLAEKWRHDHVSHAYDEQYSQIHGAYMQKSEMN